CRLNEDWASTTFFRQLSACPFCNCGAGSQNFDAAGLAASAARAAIINADAPAFTCGARTAVIDVTFENNTGANTCTDRRIKNIAITAARAPLSLSQRGGIGIVVDLDGHAVDMRDFGRQRELAPARDIGRIYHKSCLWIQRPGRADSNATHG